MSCSTTEIEGRGESLTHLAVFPPSPPPPPAQSTNNLKFTDIVFDFREMLILRAPAENRTEEKNDDDNFGGGTKEEEKRKRKEEDVQYFASFARTTTQKTFTAHPFPPSFIHNACVKWEVT